MAMIHDDDGTYGMAIVCEEQQFIIITEGTGYHAAVSRCLVGARIFYSHKIDYVKWDVGSHTLQLTTIPRPPPPPMRIRRETELPPSAQCG